MKSLPAGVEAELAQLDEIRNQLSMHGYSAMQVMNSPAQCVGRAIRKERDHDWRDAFIAALTSGASVALADAIATEAAALLESRRKRQT